MTARIPWPASARVPRPDLVATIDTAHTSVRTLASRLDLPGTLRHRLHRIADDLLAPLLGDLPPPPPPRW